jgi:hypothetical protein
LIGSKENWKTVSKVNWKRCSHINLVFETSSNLNGILKYIDLFLPTRIREVKQYLIHKRQDTTDKKWYKFNFQKQR